MLYDGTNVTGKFDIFSRLCRVGVGALRGPQFWEFDVALVRNEKSSSYWCHAGPVVSETKPLHTTRKDFQGAKGVHFQ